jgi:hypothetical protein
LHVIASASEAIQKYRKILDCFVAELAVGRAFARSGWLLAMTLSLDPPELAMP